MMYVQEGNFPGVDGRQRPGRKAEETHLENFIPRKKTSNIRESIEACRLGMSYVSSKRIDNSISQPI